MRDDCIDCGASGTPTRESRTDGGFLSRVRRCDSCEARFEEWRDQWQASLRRGRQAKVTMPLAPTASVRGSARPATARTVREGREAVLAALEGLGA